MSAVLVRDEGAVRAITLNRPERLNAIVSGGASGLLPRLGGPALACG